MLGYEQNVNSLNHKHVKLLAKYVEITCHNTYLFFRKHIIKYIMYIELNHELEAREVTENREKVSISRILQTNENKEKGSSFESVIGSAQPVYYSKQHNWGFFNTILKCYNKHWILKTAPEDWWNIIAYTVVTAIDQKSDLLSVRKFFVTHSAKKQIKINVKSFTGLDYSWLFNQFTEQIAANIKLPGYVKLIESDFSTTSSQQLITSQIMVMASAQKYFDYVVATLCGIPGVEMIGTVEDWEKLVTKFEGLKKLLEPIIEDLELTVWFSKTKTVLDKLLETYNGVPDKEWWTHILSHEINDESGQRHWWTGWMAEFLRPDTNTPADFPSGIVSVPVLLIDGLWEDTGILVAGTAGYTIEESIYNRPSVKAEHGWSLLLPKNSPMKHIITSKIP